MIIYSLPTLESEAASPLFAGITSTMAGLGVGVN
jgi:hypothetical protein